MPIHDWTRVKSYVFRDFHAAFTVQIAGLFNTGGLPAGHFAMTDRKIQLHESDRRSIAEVLADQPIVVGEAGPRLRFEWGVRPLRYLRKQPRVKIYRAADRHVVAVIETVRPDNKQSPAGVRRFAEKVAAYIESGVHVVVIDLLPPGDSDPRGIPGAVWEYFARKTFPTPTAAEPLSVTAFRSHTSWAETFLEPTAVGRTFPLIPLFLTTDLSVPTDQEATYSKAVTGMAGHYRAMLEGNAPA